MDTIDAAYETLRRHITKTKRGAERRAWLAWLNEIRARLRKGTAKNVGLNS